MTRTDVLPRVDNETDPDGEAAVWDAFLDRQRGVDVQQSSAWARVKRPGHEVERAILRSSDGRVVAGAQMLIRTFGRVVRVGYVPYGPVAASRGDALAVIEQLEAIGRDRGLAAILVQPARARERGGPTIGRDLEARGYSAAKTEVATSATIELDLDRSIEQLRAGYAKSRRKNLKSARKAGVVVRRLGADGVGQFHELHLGSAARNGFLPMSRHYLQRQCDELGVGRHVEIAVAELDGQAVAGGFFTVFNGRIDFKMTGWNPTPASRQACVNDALQDFMIEWAVGAGLDVFDLGGLPRHHAERLLDPASDRSEMESSGTAFKNAWGGEVRLDEPTFERVLHPLGHIGYRLPAALLSDRGVGGRIVNWLRRS